MKKKIPPPQATCCVCLARKQCVTERWLQSGIQQYDNFFYSDKHKGWLCAKCQRKLKKSGGVVEMPEILRRPS